MYRDNTLIPSEAIRLLALGILAGRPTPYAQLAHEVRYFAAHVVGPSLDLVGAPIELLKLEGLIEPAAGDPAAHEAESATRAPAEGPGAAAEDDSRPLHITDAGRDELMRLMTANVRPPVSDINKLIITLKMRFLHLLEPKAQRIQAEILAEMCERELARLTELRGNHADAPGHLVAWLDQEIGQTRDRMQWFRALHARLG